MDHNVIGCSALTVTAAEMAFFLSGEKGSMTGLSVTTMARGYIANLTPGYPFACDNTTPLWNLAAPFSLRGCRVAHISD